MEMELIIEITIIAVGIILFLTIKNLLPSYFNEKGKNIATKQDVEEITKKVETIKQEVSNLHFQKNELLEKRKLALLEFFELYVEFESTVKNISFVDTFIDRPERINERINAIIEKKGVVDKAFWRLSIYEMQDQKFIDQIKTIYLKQLEYYQLTLNFLYNIENNSLFVSKTQLTKELAEKRNLLKDEFVTQRNELEITTIKLPNLLSSIIRPKYLELFK